ncbi:MAG: glycosyltransferase [Ardenticatenaceae bacterium]|nr:glycosyltransferase [Ardenticatenaceae bacterium]
MTRFCLIGPTYPYRGGIAHYTTLLAEHLREEHETLLISFSRQYPSWLFPGRSDRDPSERPLRTDAEYLLDPLNPLTWRHTLHRIHDWQPDVVVIPWWHPFWTPAWLWLGRKIKRLKSRPRLLFICHNVLPHELSLLSRVFLPQITRLVLSSADRIVVHAQSDAAVLVQLLPDANYVVTPHPTYAALVSLSEDIMPVKVPDDRPLMLFAGFVRPYKGLDILLDAMPLVLQKRPVHLLVAGEFWQGTAVYDAKIRQLGISDAVTLVDEYLPNEMLAACLQRADVVVLPYRSATQSGIIQMAFGHGKPVITTDVGGLLDVVSHEHTGLIVPAENPLALSEAIVRFFAEGLGSVFKRNILRENGRFSWQHLLDSLMIDYSA